MEFNDTTTRTGLIQDVEGLLGMGTTDISSSTTRLKNFTRRINAWYRSVNSWIWNVTGTWEYDDSGKTNLPIATTNLVDDQRDYELPSSAQRITRVEVKDDDGNWHKIKAIDQSDIDSQAMEEYYETNALPAYYDMVGRSIMLYPKPDSGDVTTTNGLKLYFSRGIEKFSYNDTSTEPGFSEDFHRILSLGAAYDYAVSHNMDQWKSLQGQLGAMREDLQKFYSSRNRDIKPRILVKEPKNI